MNEDLLIHVQPTPNPRALKFVLNREVKSSGKATFSNRDEADSVKLATALFNLNGVSQLHFYENFITVTFSEEVDPSSQEENVCAVIRRNIDIHNPDFEISKSAPKRTSTDPNIVRIEELLDKTVRPGLQGDGGDIEVISYADHVLEVRYEGACGTCPSATAGTLMAIESILRDEFDPDIRVVTL